MIFRTSQHWQLWGGLHPANIGCVAEGRPQCSHSHHVVSIDRKTIYSFNSFDEADKKYSELTKELPLKELLIQKL